MRETLYEGIWTHLGGIVGDFCDFYGNFGGNVPVTSQGGTYGLGFKWAAPPITFTLTI